MSLGEAVRWLRGWAGDHRGLAVAGVVVVLSVGIWGFGVRRRGGRKRRARRAGSGARKEVVGSFFLLLLLLLRLGLWVCGGRGGGA